MKMTYGMLVAVALGVAGCQSTSTPKQVSSPAVNKSGDLVRLQQDVGRHCKKGDRFDKGSCINALNAYAKGRRQYDHLYNTSYGTRYGIDDILDNHVTGFSDSDYLDFVTSQIKVYHEKSFQELEWFLSFESYPEHNIRRTELLQTIRKRLCDNDPLINSTQCSEYADSLYQNGELDAALTYFEKTRGAIGVHNKEELWHYIELLAYGTPNQPTPNLEKVRQKLLSYEVDQRDLCQKKGKTSSSKLQCPTLDCDIAKLSARVQADALAILESNLPKKEQITINKKALVAELKSDDYLNRNPLIFFQRLEDLGVAIPDGMIFFKGDEYWEAKCYQDAYDVLTDYKQKVKGKPNYQTMANFLLDMLGDYKEQGKF